MGGFVCAVVRIITNLLAAVFYAAATVFTLASAVVYLWSIYLGWLKLGLLGVFVTVFMPILGQLVMVYKLWPSTYSNVVVLLLVCAIPLSVLNVVLENLNNHGGR